MNTRKINIEAGILGYLARVNDRVEFSRDKIKYNLSHLHFTKGFYRHLYAFIKNPENCDHSLVIDYLENNNYKDRIDDYLDLVQAAELGHLINKKIKLLDQLTREEIIKESLIEQAENKNLILEDLIKKNLSNLPAVIEDSTTTENFLDEFIEAEIKDQKTNKTTDFLKTSFSDVLNFSRGELILLGARPSIGKTALALNLAYDISVLNNKTALIYSLEMNNKQLSRRFMSALSGVYLTKFKNKTLNSFDYAAIRQAQEKLATSSIILNDKTCFKIDDLISDIKKKKEENEELELVIIDYIQLIEGNNQNNKNLEISEISRKLKLVALEKNISILALSQLSRQLTSRQDKRPILSDLRDSGGLEQDADMVLFLHREDYYKQDDVSVKGDAELIIAKNRQGEVGIIDLTFNAPINLFKRKITVGGGL